MGKAKQFVKNLWARYVAPLLRRKVPLLTEGPTDTEAACEVVRITALEPHGNADKLEIARFEMATGPTGYEVVVQKGVHRVGELAVYCSVDCVVPVAGPFAFLGQRPDGAGKTHFRLRAARLRGRYSQGLLLSLGDLPNVPYGLGMQCWDLLGVAYYRPPERGAAGPTQPTAKPRPQPMPVYSVDSLKKLPNLFDDQHQVFITEKIHGTNFRFGWVRRRVLGVPVGWRFVVGSHRVIKGKGGNHYYGEDLWETYAAQNDLAARTRGHKGYIFYGELYGYTQSGQRIQDLTYGRTPSDGPGLAVFDIRGPQGWLDPHDRLALCRGLGLPHVPVLPFGLRGEAAPWQFEDLAEGKSTLDRDTIREGIVVETVGVKPRRKAKYVSQGYLLRKEA